MTWKSSQFNSSNPIMKFGSRVQAGFDHILMDELQDTNPLQWKLMRLIRQPDAFFAVGDVNQSIFGFRYAEPELYAQYRTALNQQGKPIDELRANYRSRPEVLEIVNTTFAGPAAGIEAHELTSGRSDFLRNRNCQRTSSSPMARTRKLRNASNLYGSRDESASWPGASSIATLRF